YDSTKGNLLMDIRNAFGGLAGFFTSALSTSTDTVSRMVNGDPNATTASGSDSAAEALQISFVPAPIPPVISAQPTDRSATVGSAITFAVIAGPPPLTCQWFVTNTNNPIAGATNSSLTFSNLQTSQSGIYLVAVTNPYGTTVSSNATLTV